MLSRLRFVTRSQTKFLLGNSLTKPSVFIRPNGIQFMPLSVQQRSMSFSNKILASPIGRSLAIAAVGGTSILGLIVLGPFILIGVGGLTAVLAFRMWRFKKQLIRTGNDWPDFINTFIQQQQVFSKEKVQVENEAMKRLELWAQTEQGRNILIQNDIHPERVIESVSIRGSSFTSTNEKNEIKIELDLKNSPHSILIVTADIDSDGNICLTDIKLVTFTGNVLRIPLQQQNNGGRVIEGEFRDV